MASFLEMFLKNHLQHRHTHVSRPQLTTSLSPGTQHALCEMALRLSDMVLSAV